MVHDFALMDVDRRELVPHLALPLRRGGARLRRPPRHRRDRRDRRGRAQHGRRRRAVRRPRASDVLRPRRSTTRTQAVHRQAIRELVARDKNHPCVVLWSIANEPESDTPEARGLLRAAGRPSRARLDPTRPVGFAQHDARARPSTTSITDLFDVVMLNRYYGWYVAHRRPGGRRDGPGGRAPAAGRPSTASRSSSPSTAPTPWPGLHGLAAAPWTEEYQAELLDDVPPRLRPRRRRRRRARLELRRLRRPRQASSAWTATRRASSPATAGRRPPPTSCAGAGGL